MSKTALDVAMKVPLAALTLTLLAGAAQAQVPATLECAGVFGKDSSHVRLEQVFGKDNVTFETVPGAEGSEEKASVVFGKDTKRRIEVIWYDEPNRTRPSSISVAPQSTWRTAQGIGIGMGLAEVERINGKAFTLSGFDWDYGGYVNDWKGGTLAKPAGGCNLMVRFGIGDDAPKKPALAVSGDKKFASTNPNMRAVKPAIYYIGISYPE